MTHMPNAPLIYTLGIVRFPRFPEFEKFAEKFFAQIRAEYPHDEKFEQVIVRAEIGPAGLTMKQEPKKIWQYLSPNRDCGFLLYDDAIIFHTSNYKDSAAFLARFKLGLSRLVEIPEIGIQLITGLGIRYLDLVVPKDGETLKDYLQEWVLPKESPVAGIKIIEGAYLAKYKTDMGTLNFQVIRNPESLFPPDLQSPFLQKNGWLKERPDRSNFAVIDTDHMWDLSGSDNKFDPEKIIKTLDQLHLVPKNIFASLGTPIAEKFWHNKA